MFGWDPLTGMSNAGNTHSLLPTTNLAAPAPPPSIQDDATSKLRALMSQDPSNGYDAMLKQMLSGSFSTSDPSYQWRFNQGQQAVERSLAARGLMNSGNAAIELQQYGQGAASQEYQSQFSRLLQAAGLAGNEFQMNYNRLAELGGFNTAIQTARMHGSLGVAQLAEQKRQFNVGQDNLAEQDAGVASALQQGMHPQSQPGYSYGSSTSYPAAYGGYLSYDNYPSFFGADNGQGYWSSSSGGSGGFGGM